MTINVTLEGNVIKAVGMLVDMERLKGNKITVESYILTEINERLNGLVERAKENRAFYVTDLLKGLPPDKQKQLLDFAATLTSEVKD